jgi:hypothetical protein
MPPKEWVQAFYFAWGCFRDFSSGPLLLAKVEFIDENGGGSRRSISETDQTKTVTSGSA